MASDKFEHNLRLELHLFSAKRQHQEDTEDAILALIDQALPVEPSEEAIKSARKATAL